MLFCQDSKMTKLIQRSETNLRSFYIFNSSFGKAEGEEDKKLLFYHPRDIEQNTKIWDIGLSEAIVMFTGTFTQESDCKALHTQKTTQLFYQPEPNYWMVLVVNVPKELRCKDGVEVPEYRGCEVQDRFYHGQLRQFYNMFKLLNGTFEMHIDVGAKDEQQKLRHCMHAFFSQLIENIRFPACDAIESMCSLAYLPLDRALFLNAYSAVNTIKAANSDVKEALVLYKTQIICQGKIDPHDLYSLHAYLLDVVLLAKTEQNESHGNTKNGMFFTSDKAEQANEQAPSMPTPKVHLTINKTLQTFHLIIYRVLNVTLCLFVQESTQPNSQFYDKLLQQIEFAAELPLIAKQLEQSIAGNAALPANTTATSCVTAASGSDADSISVKYLFIDELSHKHRTNLSFDVVQRYKDIPTNVISLLLDLYQTQADKNTGANSAYCSQDIQIKTTNDFWIIGRRCNWRQFFVIIFNGKASLFNISCEAKNILERELTNDDFFGK